MSELAILGGPKTATAPFPSWPVWDDDDRRAVMGVLESGKWWMYAYGTDEAAETGVGGEQRSQVEQFEEEFARFHRVKHGVAVASGSTALEICMSAIGLEAGDEVITTPYTFFATSTCILSHNALPVYVDIDRDTYNIDPDRIEEAITERTRAILPVHFAGELADMEAINAIAKRHNLTVIEDAAQAQGVCLSGGRYAGSFGKAGIFSFQASKNLNCGEGGIVLTDSDEFADAAWSIRHYGRIKGGLWYEHHRLGSNGRMNEFSGALLRSQLRKLAPQNRRRMENVGYLYDALQDVDGLTPIELHPQAEQRSHHLCILRYDASKWEGLSRDRFVEALEAEGVPASVGYTFTSFENPIFDEMDLSSQESAFMRGRSAPIDYAGFRDECPNANRACTEEAVWLTQPLFLGDRSHMDAIVDAIRKIRHNVGELV